MHRSPSARELLDDERVRYLAAGVATQVVYLATFLAVHAWLGERRYMVAFAVAQVAAFCFAFPCYRVVVFRSRGRLEGELLRFLLVWLSALALSALLLPSLVELAGLDPVPGQVLTLVVIGVLGYLANRYISFRHRAG